MQHLEDKNALFLLLSQGAVVVTPNNRQSAALLRDYFEYHQQKTLIKPRCLPFSTVIKNAYQELQFQQPHTTFPTLLTTEQCQHLWQKTIKADGAIPYSQGLVQAVFEAWTHCQQWLIKEDNPLFHYNPQTLQFQQWWQTFDNTLQTQHFISEHQLIPTLLEHNASFFDAPFVWVCFDDFNPQQLKLQAYLKAKEQPQYHYDLKERHTDTKVFSAANTQEEYQQLVAWLKAQLQSYPHNPNTKPIGVVIPELQQESRTLKRLLLNQFDACMFDISLGEAFNEFPMVAHALGWLHLDLLTLSSHQVTLLLQSPYLGAAKAEFLQRQQVLQQSTLMQHNCLSFKQLLHTLKTQAPQLASLLTQLDPYPQKASPKEWVELFQDRLNTLGFPGDYGLNSENYQCHNRFKGLFDEFRQLSLLSPQLTTQEALETFSQLARNTVFQVQKKKAPIQISGLLEASGCEFYSLWVSGLTDLCLPQKTRLSAFIPPSIQRDLVMPHSLPAKELQFGKQTIERLQKASALCVFSYPSLSGDNPNLPSPLIKAYPSYTPLPQVTEVIDTSYLTVFEETYQVPLKPREHFSGGTALLANQAKCPFKAFAAHRLKAQPSLLQADGLNPMERGQLLHKVMELLWNRLHSQKQLLCLTPTALDEKINEAIESALAPLNQDQDGNFPPLVQDVEYTRLKRLVLACLEWEKQRAPFEIDSLEQSFVIQLSGLEFKVRVDRLDKAGSKKWVIDYKSSLPASKPWNEDRPREPQLLLYALLDEDINALAFMQLKSGQVLYSGLSEEVQELPGISPLKKEQEWATLRTSWLNQLTLLAEEFKQGVCLPNPLDSTLCKQCDFQSLCRFPSK